MLIPSRFRLSSLSISACFASQYAGQHCGHSPTRPAASRDGRQLPARSHASARLPAASVCRGRERCDQRLWGFEEQLTSKSAQPSSAPVRFTCRIICVLALGYPTIGPGVKGGRLAFSGPVIIEGIKIQGLDLRACRGTAQEFQARLHAWVISETVNFDSIAQLAPAISRHRALTIISSVTPCKGSLEICAVIGVRCLDLQGIGVNAERVQESRGSGNFPFPSLTL